MTNRSSRNVCLCAFLLSIGMALTAPVFAAQPWVSVPSTANERQQMVVTAGNLNPDSTVTVRITYPDSTAVEEYLVVDAKGVVKLAYALQVPGRYVVELFDASGSLVGTGSLGFIR